MSVGIEKDSAVGDKNQNFVMASLTHQVILLKSRSEKIGKAIWPMADLSGDRKHYAKKESRTPTKQSQVNIFFLRPRASFSPFSLDLKSRSLSLSLFRHPQFRSYAYSLALFCGCHVTSNEQMD